MAKPYLNVSQQITMLTSRKGLIIADAKFAEKKLMNIGYFSLVGGYKEPFINKMTRRYEKSTSFEDIVSLYDFDKALRELTLSYLFQVEQKIGQLISDKFCAHYGEQQYFYLSSACYTSDPKKSVAVSKLIRILDKIANQDTDHAYIVHQRITHGNVPLWVTKNAMTFGQLSKMYSLLRYQEQSAISKEFSNVNEKELARYLNALTFFRNICAHSERLYCHRLIQQDFPDKPLHAKLGLPKKGNQYIQGKRDYFGLVIALRYLLPREEFLIYKQLLWKLIVSFTRKTSRITKAELLGYMGMPANWESITRYRL
ncbi:MAG: Abi family protein [Clostridia bacterium]|nr:Abi family protein [Clostridia bacterium]